jgi:hypothetical protein
VEALAPEAVVEAADRAGALEEVPAEVRVPVEARAEPVALALAARPGAAKAVPQARRAEVAAQRQTPTIMQTITATTR